MRNTRCDETESFLSTGSRSGGDHIGWSIPYSCCREEWITLWITQSWSRSTKVRWRERLFWIPCKSDSWLAASLQEEIVLMMRVKRGSQLYPLFRMVAMLFTLEEINKKRRENHETTLGAQILDTWSVCYRLFSKRGRNHRAEEIRMVISYDTDHSFE